MIRNYAHSYIAKNMAGCIIINTFRPLLAFDIVPTQVPNDFVHPGSPFRLFVLVRNTILQFL